MKGLYSQQHSRAVKVNFLINFECIVILLILTMLTNRIFKKSMHYLRQGNLLGQLKSYFSSSSSKIKEESAEDKEPAKLDESTSSVRFGHEDEEYNKKVDSIVKERNDKLNPMMALNYADHPLKVLYAKGQFLYEENGNKVLDCINNVSHIGHCHPYFVTQMNSQNKRLLTNSRFVYDELMSCTHKLLNKLPKELCNVTFVNSGSEANDLAMQMAAFHTNKQRTICFDGAYHGITGKCMEVSPYKWNQHYKKPDHITIAEVPCFYRGKFRNSENPVQDYANYFKDIITEDTSTFICEFMQSCGGQVIPPKNFYQELYKYLRAKGVVCIGDEVQTGFARLGENYWAFEYYGVVPDILTIGKAMGNGCPVAAVICTKEIAESFKSRDMEFFSTFGGNPLAMAASSAVMDVIEWQKLQENAKETGAYLKKRLVEEILPYKNVGDIRGVGLFQGIDIVKSKESREENGELAKKIIMRMRDKLVLVSRDGPLHNVLKIKPPIVFNKENVDTLIEKLKETFEEIETMQQ